MFRIGFSLHQITYYTRTSVENDYCLANPQIILEIKVYECVYIHMCLYYIHAVEYMGETMHKISSKLTALWDWMTQKFPKLHQKMKLHTLQKQVSSP